MSTKPKARPVDLIAKLAKTSYWQTVRVLRAAALIEEQYGFNAVAKSPLYGRQISCLPTLRQRAACNEEYAALVKQCEKEVASILEDL